MGAFEEQQRANVQRQLASGAITQAQADAALAGIARAESSGGTYTGSNSNFNSGYTPTANNTQSDLLPLYPAGATPGKTIADYYPPGFNPSVKPEAPTYSYTPGTFTTPTPSVPLAPGMVATPTKDYRSQWQNEENNRQQAGQVAQTQLAGQQAGQSLLM